MGAKQKEVKTQGLRVEKARLSSLKFDDQNARHHPERNIAAIKESLLAHGQVAPLLVRKADKSVIAGNGTMEAIHELGWTYADVIYLDITEKEARALGLRMNRTAD